MATKKEKAGMLMACVSMIGVKTKGEFFDLIKYIIAHEKQYFQTATQPSNTEVDKK